MGNQYVEPGFTAEASDGADLTDRVEITMVDEDDTSTQVDKIDTTTDGRKYQIHYSVKDSEGNLIAVTRQVRVQSLKPIIELLGASRVDLPHGGQYREPGFTARSSDGKYLADKVKVTGADKINALAPTAATRMTEDLMPAEILEQLKPESVTALPNVSKLV